MKIQISAVIIAFNEEKNIARCLRSLQGVADEVIIIDSFSVDKTVEIATSLGAKVQQRAFDGYASQKNYGNDLAQNDWILSLDADEELSPILKESILQAKANPQADAYKFNRAIFYFNQWIRHGNSYPDCKVRLWNKQKGSWGGGSVHETLQLTAGTKTAKLAGDLYHYSYESVEAQAAQGNKYTSLAAADMFASGKRATWGKLLLSPVSNFLKGYFFRGGLLDGKQGLGVSAMFAHGVFLKYLKLFALQESFKISLIISTYNRKDALELVLLSVLQQTQMPFEVIVADDGSRADTQELIASFQSKFSVPLRHCWHADEGFKLSQIRNKAMAMAQGDYLVSIDGDMVLNRHFVADQRALAQKGFFVQGSRVLLSDEKTKEVLAQKNINIRWWDSGIKNRFNAMHIPFMMRRMAKKRDDIRAIRGCSMAFWREDCIRINGFNEAIIGWGREDSEFAVRLINSGVYRHNIKFAAVAYHLYHPENSRATLPENDRILADAIAHKATYCEKGINAYLS
ncbi:N-terminal domain of galactosyltransferase [Flexibacter flexilis DSM 6793]|uniref:N-terminal domain of galactosyltransferase n=1 Tax=Flexibacter flexilis DSM 6793 TaxID=927664 RepID=A0A1I1KUC1_9BACT|nr:glycosyltransferase [Flexibacter flexilis]SFC62328.1 N-terminal domain of galactosyltransferase [Flexibacter flexilis DSM 6793]